MFLPDDLSSDVQASKSTVTEVLEFDNDFDAVFNLDKWNLRE